LLAIFFGHEFPPKKFFQDIRELALLLRKVKEEFAAEGIFFP